MADVRLMYRSENAMNVGGSRLFVHFHDIVATARSRNERDGIGGFLMFDRLWFHQILEGPEERILKLFSRISADMRHRNVEPLRHETIVRRHFAEWSMGSFLAAGGEHPLLHRHGLKPQSPLDYDSFLKFALDFVSQAQAPD